MINLIDDHIINKTDDWVTCLITDVDKNVYVENLPPFSCRKIDVKLISPKITETKQEPNGTNDVQKMTKIIVDYYNYDYMQYRGKAKLIENDNEKETDVNYMIFCNNIIGSFAIENEIIVFKLNTYTNESIVDVTIAGYSESDYLCFKSKSTKNKDSISISFNLSMKAHNFKITVQLFPNDYQPLKEHSELSGIFYCNTLSEIGQCSLNFNLLTASNGVFAGTAELNNIVHGTFGAFTDDNERLLAVVYFTSGSFLVICKRIDAGIYEGTAIDGKNILMFKGNE